MYKRFGIAVLAVCLVLGLAAAATAADGALFFVNDPKDLTWTDMNRIATVCENYYRSLGIVNSADMTRFWEVVHTHGAPNAGAEKSLVACVIQDTSHPSNGSGVPRGVLIVHGNFDKEKVLELLRKNYDEHMTKAGHEPAFQEVEKSGVKVHKFGLPMRNRELTMMSFSGYCLFHSGAVGDVGLLNETVQTLMKGEAKPEQTTDAHVRYLLQPTPDDKAKLVSLVNKKYQNWRETKLMAKRKGLMRFITGKVSEHKVNFVNESIAELGQVDIQIDRMRDASINTKRMRMTSTFDNEGKARDVKKKLLSHLNDIIKSATNPEDKLGMTNNIRITCEGQTVTVESQLVNEEEQLQTFAIISSYIARSMLRDRE